MEKKTIGVLGGMGPLATADFFKKLVLLTKAECDAGHPRVLIDNNPAIPDRTAAILGRGPSPLPMLCAGVKGLAACGAGVIAIPCNTAHYYYEEIAAVSPVPVLSILDEAVAAVKRQGKRRAALLATAGTYRSGIYQKAFEKGGVELVMPDAAGQEFFYHLAYQVKAGNTNYDREGLLAKLQILRNMGAECFVLGCTEIPVAFADMGVATDVIDTSLELARAALLYAGYEVKA
ncbi:MAG TPA: amino acid racemase [Terriglobales bacterium]|nr:amino acid racemase [Terriglobales bacterium]